MCYQKKQEIIIQRQKQKQIEEAKLGYRAGKNITVPSNKKINKEIELIYKQNKREYKIAEYEQRIKIE